MCSKTLRKKNATTTYTYTKISKTYGVYRRKTTKKKLRILKKKKTSNRPEI